MNEHVSKLNEKDVKDILSKIFKVMKIAETGLVINPPNIDNWSFEIASTPLSKAKLFCFSFYARNFEILDAVKNHLNIEGIKYVKNQQIDTTTSRYLIIYYKD